MENIPLDKTMLLSLFLETLLYGVFLSLYLLTLFILLVLNKSQRRLLLPVATLLLLFATTHLLIDFVEALEAFIFNVHTIGADAYFSILSSPFEVSKTMVYAAQTILADSVIVWRCYVLNHRRLSIAIPGFTVLLTNAGLASYVTWDLSQTPIGSPISTAGAWCVTSFYILTMLLSAACSALISWRIYRTRRAIPGGVSVLLPVLIAIIESGTIYAASLLASLLTFLSGSNARFLAVNIIPPIMGTAFCLIILQVHFQVGGNSSKSAESRAIIPGHFARRCEQETYSMQPVNLVHTKDSEEMQTEIVYSDMASGNKRESVSEGVFEL